MTGGVGSLLGMLGDGSDSFLRRVVGVDLGSVELGWRVEQLVAKVGEQPGAGGGHGHAAPAAGGPVEDRPDEVETRRFAGQPADDLDPAGFAEGAFD
jgi:hypothetical protein